MTTTVIRSQRQCMIGNAMMERRFGVPSHDGTLPSALLIPINLDLGSMKVAWQLDKSFTNKTYEGASSETVAPIGRRLEGTFSVTPTPQNIKLVMNWGHALFGPVIDLPWPSGSPTSREPDTDGDVASWNVDYLELSGQAERYYGVVFTSQTISASREQPALSVGMGFIAQNRSRAFYTSPHSTTFTYTEPEGSPFLFKNAYIRVDDADFEVESFRLTVTNPVRFDGYDEDGIAQDYGMDAQQAEAEIVIVDSEETHDQIDGWSTDLDFECCLRAMFVHPSSVRRRFNVALNAGCGFFPMSPDFVASPGTPKTDYTRVKDQDIVAILGTRLDSPLDTRYIEVHKLEGSQGPDGVSPSGFWIRSEPTNSDLEFAGLRHGFASGAYLYSIAHEIVLPRATPLSVDSFDERGKRKWRVRLQGLGDGADGGGQLVDSFNPALNTEIR